MGLAPAHFSSKPPKGLPEAEFRTGQCYYVFPRSPQDLRRALTWREKAAEHGFLQAYCAAGDQYFEGQGVPRNAKRGLALCLKGAEAGDAGAQYSVGVRYRRGDGVRLSAVDALFWLTKAAEQKDSTAASFVGEMYWNGEGTPVNRDAALPWLLFAARAGSLTTPWLLGQYYYDRFIIRSNPAKDDADMESAVESAYWLTVTVRRRRNDGVVADAKKLRALIYQAVPEAKERVHERLVAEQEAQPPKRRPALQ
jgi:TPR repeat protein